MAQVTFAEEIVEGDVLIVGGGIAGMFAAIRAAEMGAIIFPPVPALYNRPERLDEVIDHTIGRILDLFEIEHTLFKRWGGAKGKDGGRSCGYEE